MKVFKLSDIGLTIEKQFRMVDYSQRLDTFKNWPFKSKDGATCTAEKLAEVGFFCPEPDEDPDALECFLCQKELNGWEPMDSPFDEHKSHSANCKFEKLCINMEDMTVEDYLEVIAKANIINILDDANKQYMQSFDNLADKYKEWTAFKSEQEERTIDTEL